MLTGEKTRREANKKKMRMERKKPQNRSNQRQPESVFFHWAGGDGNSIQISLDDASQGSALVPDKTRKVTDYVTFTNVTTVKDDRILIQLWAEHTFSPLF